MSKKENLSALAAALKVLQDESKPLHYQEITSRVLAAGLWQTNGKTPSATINARLASNIKRHGTSSAFCRVGPGLFALNTQQGVERPQAAARVRPDRIVEKQKHGTRPLVLGFIERIATNAFSDYPRQITDLVHGKHGVYALYKGDLLYYVGLATNLRNRIKQHLNDKHAGKWNRFSLYLVRKVEHIKELESMILRIADPTGNTSRGSLPGADDLRARLQKTVREEQDRQTAALFGIARRSKPSPSSHPSRPNHSQSPNCRPRTPGLLTYQDKGITQLRATYKKHTLTARVSRDGAIEFNGKSYKSPSMAGAAAVQRKTCNGWTFWEYERAKGDWVKLDTLRHN